MADIPYRVPFNNNPYKTPRKIRVVCIGAGFAGLTLAYKISHELKVEDIIDFRIYERQVKQPVSNSYIQEIDMALPERCGWDVGGQQVPRADVRCPDPHLHTPMGSKE